LNGIYPDKQEGHLNLQMNAPMMLPMPHYKRDPATCTKAKINYEVRCDTGKADRKCDWVHPKPNAAGGVQFEARVHDPECLGILSQKGVFAEAQKNLRVCKDIEPQFKVAEAAARKHGCPKQE